MHCAKLARQCVEPTFTSDNGRRSESVSFTSGAGLDRYKPRRDISFIATTGRLQLESFRGVGEPKATQTAIILHCAVVQVQEVYEHFVC